MKTAKGAAAIRAELEGLKATGKILETPTMVLCSAMPTDPDENTVYADITVSAFTGYTDTAAVAFGSAFKDTADGQWKMAAPSVNFICTAAPENVVGYAIVNAGKTVLHRAVRFTSPIVLTGLHDGFDVIPEFAYGD